jgi:tRNA threonylcarbamoyladenosine biosynthesis protein TsaE
VTSTPLRVVAHGQRQTEAVGRALAPALGPGDLLALTGELGAGKTTLIRGIAEGLGVDPMLVHSPTFVLHHVYPAPAITLHHIDLYRLGSGTEIASLALEELLEEGVVAVEWAEYAQLDAFDPVWIGIDAPDASSRVITLEGSAPERMRRAVEASPA